jgi:hypothetical protein
MEQHQGSWEMWRVEFQNLDWSRGWDRDDLMRRFPNIPQNFWQNLPSGQKFNSFNDFWNRFYQPTRTMG